MNRTLDHALTAAIWGIVTVNAVNFLAAAVLNRALLSKGTGLILIGIMIAIMVFRHLERQR